MSKELPAEKLKQNMEEAFIHLKRLLYAGNSIKTADLLAILRSTTKYIEKNFNIKVQEVPLWPSDLSSK